MGSVADRDRVVPWLHRRDGKTTAEIAGLQTNEQAGVIVGRDDACESHGRARGVLGWVLGKLEPKGRVTAGVQRHASDVRVTADGRGVTVRTHAQRMPVAVQQSQSGVTEQRAGTPRNVAQSDVLPARPRCAEGIQKS